jgi:Na+-driven multidrug efflux pump
MLFLGCVTVLFLTFGRSLVGIFTHDPAVLAAAADCLRIVSYGYVFYAWGLVMMQAFNGAGDTATPTWINFACFWLFQIPLAYYLAHHAKLGPNGVYWAVAIAETFAAATGVLVFSQGRWQSRTV